MECNKCNSDMTITIEYNYKKHEKEYNYKLYLCSSNKLNHCKCNNEIEVIKVLD